VTLTPRSSQINLMSPLAVIAEVKTHRANTRGAYDDATLTDRSSSMHLE
jgi:hypothetical protein